MVNIVKIYNVLALLLPLIVPCDSERIKVGRVLDMQIAAARWPKDGLLLRVYYLSYIRRSLFILFQCPDVLVMRILLCISG